MALNDIPRRGVVAGRFYPGEAGSLREQVETYLALQPFHKPDLENKDVLAVLSPHAGYVFSGPIAGVTLGQVRIPDRVIILGPNHTGKGTPLSVWSGGDWVTPLGAVKIDTEARAALLESGTEYTPDMAAHGQEHSLEVQLPFLQVLNPHARIVPVIVSGLPLPALRAAGEALARVVAASREGGESMLILVSSDMSHYLPHDAAAKQDAKALDALMTLDAETFHTVVQGNNISMCGVYPMTLALFALTHLGASSAKVIAYATSGQTGKAFGADMGKVVGYAGAVMTKDMPA